MADGYIDLTFDLEPANLKSNINFEITVNDVVIFDEQLLEKTKITTQITEESKEYNILLKMNGKTDSVSTVSCKLFLCEFNLSDFLISSGNTVGIYRHNYNGYGDYTEEEFDSVMGCNGIVEIKLQAPIIYWLMSKALKQNV